MKIDFEFFSVKLKNNRFTTGSEIREIFYFSEDIGKSLSEKQYLISRLYEAMSA
jgi:hypothetical protein